MQEVILNLRKVFCKPSQHLEKNTQESASLGSVSQTVTQMSNFKRVSSHVQETPRLSFELFHHSEGIMYFTSLRHVAECWTDICGHRLTVTQNLPAHRLWIKE